MLGVPRSSFVSDWDYQRTAGSVNRDRLGRGNTSIDLRVPCRQRTLPVPFPRFALEMNRSHVIILLATVLAAADTTDLAITLRTGRARARSGTLARQKQPERFGDMFIAPMRCRGLCVELILEC